MTDETRDAGAGPDRPGKHAADPTADTPPAPAPDAGPDGAADGASGPAHSADDATTVTLDEETREQAVERADEHTENLASEGPGLMPDGEGSIVEQLEKMSPEELAEREAEVAEVVAPDRDIAVEVGDTLLAMDDVTMRFGGLVALDSVSFDIKRGEILGLIGPNGAGKTTCFNALTGVYRPSSGRVLLEGSPLGRRSRHQITRLGIARTFQNIRLFGEMTALENVVVGADARHRTSVPGAILRLPRHNREERAAIDRGMALLEFVGIAGRAAEKARNLPYGDQRRLEIARALATEPKLLCLDEPAAGFNPAEKDNLMGLIRKIREDGYTVLLIEHDMRLVMGVTDRIVVLEFGRKIAEGLPHEIRENPAVIAAYLGVPDDATA